MRLLEIDTFVESMKNAMLMLNILTSSSWGYMVNFACAFVAPSEFASLDSMIATLRAYSVTHRLAAAQLDPPLR
jgi:hypothetical protein